MIWIFISVWLVSGLSVYFCYRHFHRRFHGWTVGDRRLAIFYSIIPILNTIFWLILLVMLVVDLLRDDRPARW